MKNVDCENRQDLGGLRHRYERTRRDLPDAALDAAARRAANTLRDYKLLHCDRRDCESGSSPGCREAGRPSISNIAALARRMAKSPSCRRLRSKPPNRFQSFRAWHLPERQSSSSDSRAIADLPESLERVVFGDRGGPSGAQAIKRRGPDWDCRARRDVPVHWSDGFRQDGSRQTARYSRHAFLRFDMSGTWRARGAAMIGAPPGYVGF